MMQLPVNYCLILAMVLLTSWTSPQNMDMALSNASLNNSSDFLPNKFMRLQDSQVPRNKRAVGLLLQGLVQALGYNTTPIQLASIVNVNNNSAPSLGLSNIDTRILNQSPTGNQNPNVNKTPPVPSSTIPRQRETLKFTGIVNFGNNSDLLSHLRQYEILFHGASTSSPQSSSSTASSNIPTGSPSVPNNQSPTTPPQPCSAPIPIPLLQDIQYPKPLFPIITVPSMDTRPMSVTTHHPESDKNVDDDNDDGEKSYEDVSNEHQNNYQDANDYDDDSTRNIEQSDDTTEDEITQHKENINESPKQIGQYIIIPNKESKEPLYEYSKTEIPQDEPEGDRSPFRYPTKYTPVSKYSSGPSGFGAKLPIDDKPFHVQLTNSYGESLEHSGKIDDSVADYFAKFKNPQSGIFEPSRLNDFQNYGQRLTPTERYSQQPIAVGRIQSKYADEPHAGFKYEEYKLKNNQESNELQTPSFPETQDRISPPQREKESKLYELNVHIPHDNSRTDNSPRRLINYEFDTLHEKTPVIKRIPNEEFQIHKFNPYYKPIQYIFPSESEEKISPELNPYPVYPKNFTRIGENIRNSHERSLFPLSPHFNTNFHDPSLHIPPISPTYIHNNRGTTMQPIIEMPPIEY